MKRPYLSYVAYAGLVGVAVGLAAVLTISAGRLYTGTVHASVRAVQPPLTAFALHTSRKLHQATPKVLAAATVARPPAPAKPAAVARAAVRTPSPAKTANPLHGRHLYADPSFPPHGNPAKIAGKPVARWFGDWNKQVGADVSELVGRAAGQGKLPVLVAYNIPIRDCNSYSAGGAASPEAYRQWIQSFAGGIGNREAVVILEPDALAGMGCLAARQQAMRLELLSHAISILQSQTKAMVYVDAGNAGWEPAATMADRLSRAGVGHVAGFALNVSNFIATETSVAYGKEISALTGGKRFVVDTSRNGKGHAPGNEWCNPRGRGLGTLPTTTPSYPLADALLWIKAPGESDGPCNGGPVPGVWWQAYADELAANAAF